MEVASRAPRVCSAVGLGSGGDAGGGGDGSEGERKGG